MKRAIYLSLSFLVVFAIVIVAEAKPKPVKITDLKIGSKLSYEVGPALEKGTKYYIDRDYTVVEMPKELVGIQFIMTANNDKNSTGDGFVTFKVNKPSIIWICRDSRGDEEKGGLPPDYLVEEEKYILKDSLRVIQKWKPSSKLSMINIETFEFEIIKDSSVFTFQHSDPSLK